MTASPRCLCIPVLVLAMSGNMLLADQGEVLCLAKAGSTPYIITIAESATVPERTAADELATYLKQVTGAEFAVVAPRLSAHRPTLAVGPGAAKAVVPELNLKKDGEGGLGDDGILLRTVGSTILLTGAEGAKRGTLYAVYEFLERECGIRWWSSTESTIPSSPSLNVRVPDMVYVPKLRYREAFYRDAFEGVFAAHSRCNGHFARIPPEYGNHYRILGWCHTFHRLLPPDTYFKDHPEWYSEIDGKRTAERSQLCLTNNEMRRELTRRALEWIRKEPDAGIISISQNDWHGRCRCEVCRAVEEREGTPAGLLIEFVNQVAADVEKEYPGFLVETLAYQYTRKPPALVRPRENVIIRLCSIECSYAQPLETGAQNEAFRDDIQGWSAIAPKLFIWDYVTNFRNVILPHPNQRVIAPNIRLFVKNNAIGLFEQGDAYSTCGDFVELRAWVLAKLMWDPMRDEKALVTEFLNGYYGAAAQPLQNYLDVTHDAVERAGIFLRCYMADTSSWLTADDLVRATECFDAAAGSVKDDPLLALRLRRARMPLDHAWLQRSRSLARYARLSGKAFQGPRDPVVLCKEFIESAHEFKNEQYGEGRPFKALEERLLGQFLPGTSAPPPAGCAGLRDEDWLDVQEHEFRLFKPGTWVRLVDDEHASNGKAAWLPANHTQWAVQCPLGTGLSEFGLWHCYIVARCQAQDGVSRQETPAFEMGLYDTPNRRGVANRKETLQTAANGTYHTYDLGVHDLKGGMYFWVAPMNNPDDIEGVWVDRIVLIREGATKPQP